MGSVRGFEDRFLILKDRRDSLVDNVAAGEEELSSVEAELAVANDAKSLLLGAQQMLIERLESDLNTLVNLAISDVFPDRPDSSFVAEFTKSSNRFVLNLSINRRGKIMPIIGARGGGLVDTVEVALRVVSVCLSNNMRVLLLDQPFANLSEDRLELCGRFISAMCRQLGIQVIAVVHQKPFEGEADNVISLEYDGDKTKVLGAPLERERLSLDQA